VSEWGVIFVACWLSFVAGFAAAAYLAWQLFPDLYLRVAYRIVAAVSSPPREKENSEEECPHCGSTRDEHSPGGWRAHLRYAEEVRDAVAQNRALLAREKENGEDFYDARTEAELWEGE
jgi:hypothetical protein